MARPAVSAQELAYYRAHGREAVREDGVVCLECGAVEGRLGSHIAVHAITLAGYRAKWGYPRAARLAVPPPLEAARRRGAGPGDRRPPVPADSLEHHRARLWGALTEDGVVCLECGGIYRMVGGHVRVHALTIRQYRAKWGYNTRSRLVTPALHKRKRDLALARNFGTMSPPGSWRKARQAYRQQGRTPDRPETTVLRADITRARLRAGWRPHEKRKVPDEALRALAAERLSVQEVAARIARGIPQTKHRLRALGLRVPGMRPPPVPLGATELLALRRAGLSARAIAERTGLTFQAVRGRLRRLRQRLGPRVLRPGGRRDDRILALAQEGLRLAQVAARVGVPRKVASEWLYRLRKRGLQPPAGRPARSLAEIRERDGPIVELCGAGLWPGEIAARTGLPAGTISRRLYRLRRRGLAPPPGPRRAHNRKVTDEELLELVRQGLRPADIAARAGMVMMSVYHRLRLLRRRGLLAALPPGPRRPKPKQIDDGQVLALARAGLRRGEIARRLGFSSVTVTRSLRALRQQGLLPAPGAELSERDRRIFTLAGAGLSTSAIARRTGLKYLAVYKRLRRLTRRGLVPALPPRTA